MSQLTPPITTATGTLSRTYRKAGAKMPSKSGKQHRFMEMIAHGGKPRSGKGPPVSVAKDFVAADKGRSFPKKKEPPGELEQAEDTREIDALRSSVKKRSAKIKAKRGRQ